MNRDKEWDFIDNELKHLEDNKSLLATFAILVKELALQCPNDKELGKEVRQLISKYKTNTNTNR